MRTLEWVLCLGAVFTGFPALASPTDLRFDLSFPNPQIPLDSRGTSTPQFEGLLNTVEAGMPSVPVKTLRVALPSGYDLDEITFDSSRPVRMSTSVHRVTPLPPASWRRRLPANVRRIAPPELRGQYPAERLEYSLQKLHGVSVAVINFYPVVVRGNGYEIDFVSDARIRLSLKLGLGGQPELTDLQRAEVIAAVDNADVVDTYAAADRAGYDYLVISTADLIGFSGPNGFADFQAGLTQRGLNSKLVDVKTIESATQGTDLAEKIRNYIRQEYLSNHIQYVLLAGRARTGSAVFLPSRPLWSKIRAYMGYWMDLEENIPGDIYYGCLDGSFNGNGNAKWGEPNDGDNDGDGGGDVDFMCEVTVGRVALEKAADLQHFVGKTLWAYTHPMPRTAGLFGEELFSELNLDGSDYMEQLIGTFTDHGFTTAGFDSSFKLEKLYDRTAQWSGTDALGMINGPALSMVNHLGHSNESYNMRLSSSQLTSMKNSTPFFFYTQGCLAGNFPAGSFVDKIVSKDMGAVAAVGNSSYGLAPEDPDPGSTRTPGGSQMLHREFLNGIFGKGVASFGKAHQESKLAFIGLKSAQEIRWVHWTATYFGDPSLSFDFK